MNLAPTIILQLASVALALTTATSMFIHETNVDKALITAAHDQVGLRTPVAKAGGNDPHTHAERGSLHQAIRDLNASQPRIQPRNQNDKKYVQAKPTARGHHPFDNYTLPVVS